MKIRSVSLLIFVAVCGSAQHTKVITARQVVGLIQQHVGVPWRSETVDTFKAGDPDTPVTGIATTMMATYDVLRRTAAQNANLIITHERTFYSHEDQTAGCQAVQNG